MSFAVFCRYEKCVDVIDTLLVGQTQSLHRALPSSHLRLICGTLLHCACLFGILPTLQRSGSRGQAARCEKHVESVPHMLTINLPALSSPCLCRSSAGRRMYMTRCPFLGNVLCRCRSVSTSTVSLCSSNSQTS